VATDEVTAVIQGPNWGLEGIITEPNTNGAEIGYVVLVIAKLIVPPPNPVASKGVYEYASYPAEALAVVYAEQVTFI
jgi:hypothetical protein